MADLKISRDLVSLSQPSQGADRQIGGSNFGSVLKNTIQEINQLQTQADQAISKVELEKSGSIHEAMIALEKADISFRTMLQVRNKIIEAYQEVMRMQV